MLNFLEKRTNVAASYGRRTRIFSLHNKLSATGLAISEKSFLLTGGTNSSFVKHPCDYEQGIVDDLHSSENGSEMAPHSRVHHASPFNLAAALGQGNALNNQNSNSGNFDPNAAFVCCVVERVSTVDNCDNCQMARIDDVEGKFRGAEPNHDEPVHYNPIPDPFGADADSFNPFDIERAQNLYDTEHHSAIPFHTLALDAVKSLDCMKQGLSYEESKFTDGKNATPCNHCTENERPVPFSFSDIYSRDVQNQEHNRAPTGQWPFEVLLSARSMLVNTDGQSMAPPGTQNVSVCCQEISAPFYSLIGSHTIEKDNYRALCEALRRAPTLGKYPHNVVENPLAKEVAVNPPALGDSLVVPPGGIANASTLPHVHLRGEHKGTESIANATITVANRYFLVVERQTGKRLKPLPHLAPSGLLTFTYRVGLHDDVSVLIINDNPDPVRRYSYTHFFDEDGFFEDEEGIQDCVFLKGLHMYKKLPSFQRGTFYDSASYGAHPLSAITTHLDLEETERTAVFERSNAHSSKSDLEQKHEPDHKYHVFAHLKGGKGRAGQQNWSLYNTFFFSKVSAQGFIHFKFRAHNRTTVSGIFISERFLHSTQSSMMNQGLFNPFVPFMKKPCMMSQDEISVYCRPDNMRTRVFTRSGTMYTGDGLSRACYGANRTTMVALCGTAVHFNHATSRFESLVRNASLTQTGRVLRVVIIAATEGSSLPVDCASIITDYVGCDVSPSIDCATRTPGSLEVKQIITAQNGLTNVDEVNMQEGNSLATLSGVVVLFNRPDHARDDPILRTSCTIFADDQLQSKECSFCEFLPVVPRYEDVCDGGMGVVCDVCGRIMRATLPFRDHVTFDCACGHNQEIHCLPDILHPVPLLTRPQDYEVAEMAHMNNPYFSQVRFVTCVTSSGTGFEQRNAPLELPGLSALFDTFYGISEARFIAKSVSLHSELSLTDEFSKLCQVNTVKCGSDSCEGSNTCNCRWGMSNAHPPIVSDAPMRCDDDDIASLTFGINNWLKAHGSEPAREGAPTAKEMTSHTLHDEKYAFACAKMLHNASINGSIPEFEVTEHMVKQAIYDTITSASRGEIIYVLVDADRIPFFNHMNIEVVTLDCTAAIMANGYQKYVEAMSIIASFCPQPNVINAYYRVKTKDNANALEQKGQLCSFRPSLQDSEINVPRYPIYQLSPYPLAWTLSVLTYQQKFERDGFVFVDSLEREDSRHPGVTASWFGCITAQRTVPLRITRRKQDHLWAPQDLLLKQIGEEKQKAKHAPRPSWALTKTDVLTLRANASCGPVRAQYFDFESIADFSLEWVIYSHPCTATLAEDITWSLFIRNSHKGEFPTVREFLTNLRRRINDFYT